MSIVSLKPLGAGQEVGRSCVIVKIKELTIMFDCGVHMCYNDSRKFPDFKRILNTNDLKEYKDKDRNEKSEKSDKNDKFDKNYNDKYDKSDKKYEKNIYHNLEEKTNINYNKHVDLIIITHFHLDHCGALPYFTEICGYNGPIVMSQPTKAIIPLMLEDFRRIISDYKGERSILQPNQIKNCINKITTIELGEEKIIGNRIKVSCFYAGHVLGASMFRIEVDGYSVVYTGDYNTSPDRHLGGAYIPRIYPDILITETTYGDTIRDTKKVREREFLKRIQTTIDK